MCKIANVCCLPAPAHQPFSSNNLDLSAPEEAYRRNVRASGTLKLGYEGCFKILEFLLLISLPIASQMCLMGSGQKIAFLKNSKNVLK